MKYRALVLVAALLGVVGPVLAQEPTKTPSALPQLSNGVFRDQVDKISATKRLPVYGLSIVETTDGKVFLVSDNGRFAVIGGRWIDLWEGRNITGISDSGSLDKLNFGRMGINVDEFSPFIIGNGPKAILAFVDPVCDECRAMVRQMVEYGKEYTFKVVVLPLRGQPSGVAARRLQCSPDRKMAMDAFLSGSYTSLPEPAPTCDVNPIQKAMIAATVLGIRSTPLLILPDFTTVNTNGHELNLNKVLKHK